MYVVRRTFRNFGQMIAPGSIVEPGTVKRFKSRLNDGHIVEVTEQDFTKWQKYFKERIGVEIKLPEKAAEPAKTAKVASAAEPANSAKSAKSAKSVEPEKVTKIVKPAANVVKAR